MDAAEGSAVEVKKRKERKVRVYMNEKPAGAKTCSGAVEIIKDSVQAGKRVVIKWAMKPWKHTTRGTAELNKDASTRCRSRLTVEVTLRRELLVTREHWKWLTSS